MLNKVESYRMFFKAIWKKTHLFRPWESPEKLKSHRVASINFWASSWSSSIGISTASSAMPHVTWCCKHDNVAISKAVAGKQFFRCHILCLILIVHDFVSYSFIFSSCFTKTWSKRLQLHTERKWTIDRSHRWKEATFSNDPRWKIQRHTAKIYLSIYLFVTLHESWMILDDFPFICQNSGAEFLFRLSPHATWHDQLLQSSSFAASSALPAFESLGLSHRMKKVSQAFNLPFTFNNLHIQENSLQKCMTYMMLQSSTWSSFTGLDLLVLAHESHCFPETRPVQHRPWPQLRAEPKENKNQH